MKTSNPIIRNCSLLSCLMPRRSIRTDNCHVKLRNSSLIYYLPASVYEQKMTDFLDIIHCLSLIINVTFRKLESVSIIRYNLLRWAQLIALGEIGTRSINWAQHSRFYLKMDTDSSLRNVMFLIELRWCIMPRKFAILKYTIVTNLPSILVCIRIMFLLGKFSSYW
jgi:hypothetical protein